MVPLLVLRVKQTTLKTLKMDGNFIFDPQKQQIRQVVTQNAPECTIEGEIYLKK